MDAQPARYVKIPVACSQCEEKQVVHVRAPIGFSQDRAHAIECLHCHAIVGVLVPDDIIDGPFPWQP
jgi:hypothetical protein